MSASLSLIAWVLKIKLYFEALATFSETLVMESDSNSEISEWFLAAWVIW